MRFPRDAKVPNVLFIPYAYAIIFIPLFCQKFTSSDSQALLISHGSLRIKTAEGMVNRVDIVATGFSSRTPGRTLEVDGQEFIV